MHKFVASRAPASLHEVCTGTAEKPVTVNFRGGPANVGAGLPRLLSRSASWRMQGRARTAGMQALPRIAWVHCPLDGWAAAWLLTKVPAPTGR